MHFGREQGGRGAVVAYTALSNGGVLAQAIIDVPARHPGRLGLSCRRHGHLADRPEQPERCAHAATSKEPG